MDGSDLDDFLMAHLVFGASDVAMFDERELGREFDVPRASVRGSLARLVENGVITRARRVGTVPAQAWRRHDLLNPANNSLEPRNLARHFRVLSLQPVRARGALAARLDLAAGTDVTRIHRLSLVGGSVLDSWVVWSTRNYEDYVANRDDLEVLEWNDIVARMTSLKMLRVRRASSTIQASGADAEMFGVDRGTPLNFTDVTVRSPSGELVARSFVRALSQRSVNISEALVPVESVTSTDER